jgi:hypothetical protein
MVRIGNSTGIAAAFATFGDTSESSRAGFLLSGTKFSAFLDSKMRDRRPGKGDHAFMSSPSGSTNVIALAKMHMKY